MNTTRRNFLRTSASALTAGGIILSPAMRNLLGATVTENQPSRFIFIHKGNGLLPSTLVLPSLSDELVAKEKRGESYEVDLKDHTLPNWMLPLNEHKSDMTILQGLSGKMCTTGHHTWQSSLGVYKATERLSSIKWATIDFELARLFPSPMGHIELACFPSGGGNARGNINGIEMGFSARGPEQPNYAFGSPKVAMQELFKSVSSDKTAQTKYELERRVLEFAASNEKSLTQQLRGIEKSKVMNYADSIDDIRQRNEKIDAMVDVIRRHVPKLDKKYFADDVSTTDRQTGHTEILLSALISGLTHVVTFTADELGTIYTGLPGLEKDPVNLHDVGHGKSVGNVQADEVRAKVRNQHMNLINTIVTRLKSVPEGDGNMFDNTMLCYFPDNGETHHSHGTEWPFIVLAGRNTKLDIAGKYIRLPKHGQLGHQTLGNWYTTLLNAYGNPIEHFGAMDLELQKMSFDQQGPIKRFLG